MATNETSPAHTPGPWRVWRTSTQCVVRAEDSGETFTIVAATPGPSGNAEADARLVAAAPDLLAACNAALDLLSDLDDEASGEAFSILVAAANRAERPSPEPDHANAA